MAALWVAAIKGVVTGILGFAVGIGFLAVTVGAPLGYFGVFGQTGADYFKQCWERSAAPNRLAGAREPQPTTAGQAVAWAKCEPTAQRVVYGAGLVFASFEAAEGLYRACPPSWAHFSLADSTVQLAVKAGGPSILDHFMPAGGMIERLWTDKWPHCSAARERLGFPRVIEVSPDNFAWERACPRC